MPSNAANIAPQALLEPRLVLIAFSGLVLVLLLAALDSTIVATALPTIVSDLGGMQHLAWVVTGYLLAQTVVTPIYGKLGDLYGRKIVLQLATVLFLAGSLAPSQACSDVKRATVCEMRPAASGANRRNPSSYDVRCAHL